MRQQRTVGKQANPPSGGIADRLLAGRISCRQQEVLWNEQCLSLAGYVETAPEYVPSRASSRGGSNWWTRKSAEEKEIDRWEVRIETECLRVLALFGLVATDLRRVVAALRVNRDLEGMADLAENLAKPRPQAQPRAGRRRIPAPPQPARQRGDRGRRR